MKKIVLTAAALFLLTGFSSASDEAKREPNQLFYKGNSFYEKRDYAKAVESYLAASDLGVMSGHLYYNTGNGFFKLEKIGYAILYYEKAKRIMPGDSDLKSNLDFAKSMV